MGENNNRQHGYERGKKRGWDNAEFSREQREQREDPRPRRLGFDPSLLKVVGEVGTVKIGESGKVFLVVEYVSYDGGPRQVQIRKRGLDRNTGEPFFTNNIGRLWPNQLDELTDLLDKACEELAPEPAKPPPASR